jgi:hypothetical protein
MDLKEQANKLIKLAEQIEKEASDYTFFICSNCNHTASLKDINDRRTKIASQEDPEMAVKPVTINDTVACPVAGCEGNMNYVATDESEKYYVEAGKEETPAADAPAADEPTDKAEEDTGKKEDTGDIDKEIDDLFEDVETQNEKVKEEKKDKAETTQKARKEKKEKDQETSLLDEGGEKDKSETPKDTDPLAEPIKSTEPDPAAIKEKDEEGKEPEDVIPDEKPKPKKKKEPIDIEKKDVPKFKSKEASDRYAQSVSRYSL